MKHIVILSGAGMSAESGIATFRASDGLWENHRIEDVASPDGFRRNPALVFDFYNKRRAQLYEVAPNTAHLALAALEKTQQVSIITQNVDDLHERAGSTQVLHLHGELRKARSLKTGRVYQHLGDMNLGTCCEDGGQLRPHIVWFGEAVPNLERAATIVSTADEVWIIGTSMQVYPAAGLIDFASKHTPIFYIDPNPAPIRKKNVTIVAEKASVGVPNLIQKYTL